MRYSYDDNFKLMVTQKKPASVLQHGNSGSRNRLYDNGGNKNYHY